MSSQAPTKSWQARLQAAADKLTEQFVESISLDHRLWRYDMAGSLAHAEMLADVGLMTKADFQQIKAGFKTIEDDINRGAFPFDQKYEDIHMVLEAALIDRIGEPGKKLHTARSRNDQVALDIRLWLRDQIDLVIEPALREIQRALLERAKAEGHLLMPAYTHLQRAQPILAGAALLAYVEQFDRDRCRFLDARTRINVCPLGAGAVAGTTLPIDREKVAQTLGFLEVAANSIDATSDRDVCIEYASCCATTMMHLSRLAEDWILYNTREFGFLTIDDAFCTGSSMMPQKRNPDLLELIRGKTGRVYGALTGLFTLMKGMPLAYNRDMQEDKFHLFTAHDTTVACIEVATAIVRHSHFNAQSMAQATKGGFLDATVLAEYLVERGMPFRQAHGVVGRLVAQAEAQNLELSGLSLAEMQSQSDLIREDVHQYLGAEQVVKKYRSIGSAGVQSVKEQIRQWAGRLGMS
jgi:argininosuccinate lyase